MASPASTSIRRTCRPTTRRGRWRRCARRASRASSHAHHRPARPFRALRAGHPRRWRSGDRRHSPRRPVHLSRRRPARRAPAAHTAAASIDDFNRRQDAASGRIVLVHARARSRRGDRADRAPGGERRPRRDRAQRRRARADPRRHPCGRDAVDAPRQRLRRDDPAALEPDLGTARRRRAPRQLHRRRPPSAAGDWSSPRCARSRRRGRSSSPTPWRRPAVARARIAWATWMSRSARIAASRCAAPRTSRVRR